MKQICIGILAHVDAGKTTLSEALLYRAGAIRRLGRVDHQDAFLDTDAMERQRGITIFSKQAVLELGETRVTLLDTPGHVDFSAEMERTLQVLDCAVLVISGTDGVQGHTRTLWDLLERYQMPTFLFINKMDLAGADRAALLAHLKNKLSGGCVDFGGPDTLWEEAAVCDEAALEQYLEMGELPEDMISRLIGERKLFPCYFGSALKVEGVDELLAGVERYAPQLDYPAEFGAKVFKITRDAQGARLTHMKITGGALRTKELLTGREGDTVWQEKGGSAPALLRGEIPPRGHGGGRGRSGGDGPESHLPRTGVGDRAGLVRGGLAAGPDLPGGAGGRHGPPHGAAKAAAIRGGRPPASHCLEQRGDPRSAHGRGADGGPAAACPGADGHGDQLWRRGCLLPGDHRQRRGGHRPL